MPPLLGPGSLPGCRAAELHSRQRSGIRSATAEKRSVPSQLSLPRNRGPPGGRVKSKGSIVFQERGMHILPRPGKTSFKILALFPNPSVKDWLAS